MAQTVIGVFDDASEAQQAMQELMEAGFSRNNIDLSAQTSSDMTGSSSYQTDSAHTHENREEKGGISGFFASLFGTDDDDDRRLRDNYTTVGDRHSILTVHAMDADEAQRAADIMDDAGAIDVDERANQYRSSTYADNRGSYNTDEGYSGSTLGTGVSADPLAPAYGVTSGITTSGTTNYADTNLNDRDTMDRGRMDRDEFRNTTNDESLNIPIIDEQLNVGKRTVERGGMRLRSRIVERPVEESVRLREERVRVDRNPVNRPATDADFTAFREGDVEMVEHAEVPVVGKEARVVEEVRLNKDVTERDETIRDTVRHTDVDVQNLSGTNADMHRTDSDRTIDPERDVTNRGL